MKGAIIVALLFVVVIQTCNAQDLPPEMTQSFENCVKLLNVNRSHYIELNEKVVLPEDDEEIIKFFECYSKEAGVVDDQEHLVFSKILERTEARVKLQMEGILDGDVKARQIANLAVEHCKPIPKKGPSALDALKQRNCIRSFISRPQLFN